MLSAVGLTYEIAAGRVLAPFFGTSLLTWTTVIAVVLAGFSLGSALGGLIAERPRAVAIGQVRAALVASAVLMAVSPMFLGFLHAAGISGTGGMLLSVFLVFFPASVCITLPSPFLAKVAVDARPGRAGSSLGLVLAAGSVGAIFGAILAGFVTLPLIGSTATFAACGAIALLCIPFIRHDPQEGTPPSGGPDMVISLAAAGFVGFAGLAGQPVCQFESGLSCLHVTERGGLIRLISDGTTQAAEPAAPEEENPDLALSYTRHLWARMQQDLPADANVLFIGGGGYSLPTQLLTARPDARATAVEIDPLVTEVVMDHLPQAAAMIVQTGYLAADGAPQRTGRLGIVHADGRVYLNETADRFDAAVMDVFSSASVPAHLATRETYARLRDIVDGPVYVNLIDAPDGTLVRGVHAILKEIYPHVIAVRGPAGRQGRANLLLAASPTPLAPLPEPADGYRQTEISSARPFTDDRGWVGHR